VPEVGEPDFDEWARTSEMLRDQLRSSIP